MEYYVFITQNEAQVCIDAINGSGYFPITGNCCGVAAPDKQKTTNWIDTPREMTTGSYAVPRIPDKSLNALKVTQDNRDDFLAEYGQDIRHLSSNDFVQLVEE